MGYADERNAYLVKSIIQKMKLNKNIKCLFNVSRDKALKTLASTKVMVYPTRFDSYSLVVLEALSCGTPVIAYAIPGIRFNYNTDAVIKVKPLSLNGLFTNARQVLDQELWEELGRKGRKFTSRYTWHNVARAEWECLKVISQKEIN